MSNTLRNFLNANDAIDQLRLSLNSAIGSSLVYILVEGIYDCVIYPKFFDEMKINVEFVGGGKGHVILALQELNKITKNILGICDADFRHLENDYPPIQNLFFTDCHDIEMTMLSVDSVLYNASAEYRLQGNIQAILCNVLNEIAFVGYARWYNERNMTELKFKGLGLGSFISWNGNNVTLDGNRYLYALNSRSPNKTRSITITDIVNFRQANNTSDVYNLCNGHDVTALLALIIGNKISHETFCSVLRASFRIIDFNKCKLYANIQIWQEANGFAILQK
jgi:hypothetical protein